MLNAQQEAFFNQYAGYIIGNVTVWTTVFLEGFRVWSTWLIGIIIGVLTIWKLFIDIKEKHRIIRKNINRDRAMKVEVESEENRHKEPKHEPTDSKPNKTLPDSSGGMDDSTGH